MEEKRHKELEKMNDLELSKLALELELPMVKGRAELIQSILKEIQGRPAGTHYQEKEPRHTGHEEMAQAHVGGHKGKKKTKGD
ncbi:MAG: hypothetical protein M0018_07085 [Nitrospiraceae bacterium]|nr:hypothetical protein [Nitrospiraceae bacterium]